LSKDKDNIIPFPGMKKFDNSVDEDSIDKANKELLLHKEETEMIEHSIDECAIDIIRHLVDIGCDINKKHFYGDLALVTEVLRGMIFRDFDKQHLAQALIDKVITIEYNANGEVQPIINYNKVLTHEDLPGQKLDFGDEGEKEIVFEPDFEFPEPEDDK
tara:strand:- start:2277 stop:2753 length:477 start_codon:yes stop_codon:yes gene_type:complete